MADSKISDLAAVTTVEDSDEFAVARAGATKKISGADLKAEVGGGEVTQAELDAHAADTTSVHGIPDTSVLVVDADLAAHVADSTGVHGIPDTANLLDISTTLDEIAAPAADVSLNNQKIVGLATPTDPTDAATKAYADAIATGLDVKLSVRAATTANVTLSGAQTIDGVALVATDRVLVKNQTAADDNGIYTVAAGAWARSTDADADAEVTSGMFTFVEGGTAHADQGWVLATNNPITLDTTPLTFTQFSGVGSSPTGAAGGVLSGTYPNPAFAADMATQAELVAHDADTTSVHGIANTAVLVTQAYQTVEDEGAPVTQRNNLNFAGAGVTVTDAGGKSLVTVPGGTFEGYSTIEDEGTPRTQRTTANFVGAGVSVIDSGGITEITIPGTAGGTGVDGSLAWRLNGVHNAGATTINLNAVPLAVGANLGYVIIDPYTVEAEIRKVTAKTSSTFTVAATTYNHADGDVVLWWNGGLVPWNLWGAKPGSTAFASDNVLAFNRLTQQLYNMLTYYFGGIFVPPGLWYVDNELRMERDQILQGSGIQTTKIQAHTTFPAFTNEEVAIIHCVRDGDPCTFLEPGPSARWGFRDLLIDGASIAGSNGILASPQQPDGTYNLRIDNCKGYGLGISDIQQAIIKNFEGINNGISFRARDARFVYIDGFNSENHDTYAMLWDASAAGNGCWQNHIENVHLEGHDSLTGTMIRVDNSSASPTLSRGWLFDHIFATVNGTQKMIHFVGAAVPYDYEIQMMRAYGSPATVIAIEDEYRGLSLNARDHFDDYVHSFVARAPAAFAAAARPYGTPSYHAYGDDGEQARISVSASGASYHTSTFQSKLVSGNSYHFQALDTSNAEVFRVTYAGGLIVGGGTELKKILSATATYDPPSTADGAMWSTTVAVTGATVLNSVARASHDAITAAGWILSASVTSAGVVTVVGFNKTGGTVDLASGTLRVVVEQF